MRSTKRGTTTLARFARGILLAVTVAATAACQSSGDGGESSGEPPTGITGQGDTVSLDEVNAPCCLVATDTGVWVLNLGGATMQHINPDTNRAGAPIYAPHGGMLSAGENIALYGEDGLAIFDPDSKKFRPVPKLTNMEEGPVTFDPRTETLWAGTAVNGSLSQVDPNTGKVIEVLAIKGLPSTDRIITAGAHQLWITTWDGDLVLIDLPTKRVVTRSRPFGAEAEIDIALAGGSLWAVAVNQSTLLRLNPKTGRVEDRRQIETAGTAFPRMSQEPDGTLWLATAPNHLEQLDPRSGDTLASYDIPFSKDANLDDYYYGGVATGFGSVWTAVLHEYGTDDAVVRLNLR